MPAPTNDFQRLNPLIRALHTMTAWLESHHIPYMVFGGVANSLHGNPRQTFDIDINLALPRQMEAASFLEALGKEAEILPEDPKRFLSETNVIPIEIEDVRVDLVLGELPFEIEAIQRSRLMDVFGREIRVCLPEDLVIQKAVSNREKDGMDIQEIIRLQGHTMDRDYLLGHVKDLADLLSDSESTTGSRDGSMPNPYEAMREKLSRFNAWEAERLKATSLETRLKRFLVLHDLGRSWDSSVIEKRQAQHLQSLVACGKRLKDASSRRHKEGV